MSAYVVDKNEIDLLVRAALHAYPAGQPGTTRALSWWQVDENGEYAGWRELSIHAEHKIDDDYKAFYTPSQLGQILVSENVRSVAFRYSEPGRVSYYGSATAATMDDLDPDAGELPGPCDAYYMGPYVYTDPGRDLTPGEVFRAIDCLDYQSCEHEGWTSSEAYSFLRSLRKAYCDRVADSEGTMV